MFIEFFCRARFGTTNYVTVRRLQLLTINEAARNDMSQLRGKITRISFVIEYPDGTTKESSYDPQHGLRAVLISDKFMTEEMRKLFTRSESDWKKNPAMIIVDGKMSIPNCDYPQCQNA